MTATLLYIKSTLALPMPEPMLPKITIRHDSPSQSPTETGLAVEEYFMPSPGTHGKRQQYSLSESIKIAPTPGPTIRVLDRHTQLLHLHQREKERALRARFYPFDAGNSTSASKPPITPSPLASVALSSSTDGLNISSPSSQISLPNPSNSVQPFTITGSATTLGLSSAASAPDIVTDTSPPLLPIDLTLPAAWIQTLPPTTALSTPVPLVPEPQPNLATQSWVSGTAAPTPTTSQKVGISVPSEGGNTDCPFQPGVSTSPDAETTPDQTFPVIVTVLPVSTSFSAGA
ncbi:uncharacterized protein Z519_12412 [Cladophialophora bantiana CBS 173.52]|uniref:Uncharacterized protein n=1 Tax=Cladophialophora bantiana (strain ATCC 10958 / CBS 173.52 / CDC B-1940 / NIH 8579) TaxID=1442370 RepID=A0A0D2FJS4_CLAB1|nr:uncharacterized protein Z519_12412 [Cladophialophora bantiana CBS 173.52]KIW86947.1 hypothetical protein Z519_12412 [Cladophialophora bantiana CBS 173.52]